MTGVNIIIATLGERARLSSLDRAIGSVRMQQGVRAIPVVVLNGQRYDPTVRARLEARSDIVFRVIEEAGLPRAIHQGRLSVEEPYFGFLDDDDEYLTDTLAKRMMPFLTDQACDVVVTNGYRSRSGSRAAIFENFASFETDPLKSLAAVNWLPSCAGLFRTEAVGATVFEDLPKYVEWTMVAFRLCVAHRLKFLNDLTYLIHDTPDSLSKSDTSMNNSIELCKFILTHPMSANARRLFSRKLGNLLHADCQRRLTRGQYSLAWRRHIESLLAYGGYRYAAYTRRLLLAALRKSPGAG